MAHQRQEVSEHEDNKGGAPNFGRFLISDKLAFMLDFSETR